MKRKDSLSRSAGPEMWTASCHANAHTLTTQSLLGAYLRFRDAMLGEFHDGKVATADGPFDVVEAHADRLLLLLLAITNDSARRFLHLHHHLKRHIVQEGKQRFFRFFCRWYFFFLSFFLSTRPVVAK